MAGITNAIYTGILAARDAYNDPENFKTNSSNAERKGIYRKNWQIYTNQAFENLSDWKSYIDNKGLYEYTRLLYNPFRRLVDFYAGRVYPGRLSLNGQPFPNGVRLAIPFADDIAPELAAAIAQLWQWSNFQMQMRLAVRYASVCGNCLGEIIDDTDAGRVRLEVQWAGVVDASFLILDAVGNVKQYALEYPTQDAETGKEYVFRKEVTQDSISWFSDGNPMAMLDSGETSIPNPYGFAPAVWVKHTDLGGDFGSSVFRGNYAKLDELNSMATHCVDLVHKKIDPPIIIFGSMPIPLSKNPLQQGEMAESEGFDVRRDIEMWKSEQGGSTQNLVGDLDLTAAMDYMNSLILEIEKDHPELTFWAELRAMSQVTGPAAQRLLGDSESYYDEACSNYDSGFQRWFQMGVAIAGMRRAEGLTGWLEDTPQRAKFDGFNLESYEKDLLTVDITPRPLLLPSEEDEITLTDKKLGLAQKASGLFPLDKRLELAGIVDEQERAKLLAAQQAEEALVNANENGNGF